VQGVGQVAAHVGIAEPGARAGVGSQVLRVGEQLIDLPIAVDPAGGHAHSAGGRPFKCALMQRADGADRGAGAGGAQMIAGRQLLGIREARAGRLSMRGGCFLRL